MTATTETFQPQVFAAWRERAGLLQKDIALKTRYTRSMISRIERGLAAPTPRFIELLHERFPETLAEPLFQRNGHRR